jgi:FPC/CPF motif-containing protein YcgG
VLTPVNQQLPEIAKTVASRSDIPADVTSSFEAFSKEITAAMQRFAAAAGAAAVVADAAAVRRPSRTRSRAPPWRRMA